MAGALSGSLSQMSLVDVIKFLISGKQTGELDLERAKENGKIYLRTGKIIHANCGLLSGEEAVFELLKWKEGNFNFNPDEGTNESTIEKATEELLEEGIKKAQEWLKIKEVIPSGTVIFKLSAKKSPAEVKLKSKEWTVLTQINGSRTVMEIADVLRLDEFEATKILYDLYTTGLLEISSIAEAPAKEVVSEEFFNTLESELTKILGPVASIIIEDHISSSGETKEAFAKDKIAPLVESLSAEISDMTKRLAFQQVMLNELKKL
jgi:hypothetical protein